MLRQGQGYCHSPSTSCPVPTSIGYRSKDGEGSQQINNAAPARRRYAAGAGGFNSTTGQPLVRELGSSRLCCGPHVDTMLEPCLPERCPIKSSGSAGVSGGCAAKMTELCGVGPTERTNNNPAGSPIEAHYQILTRRRSGLYFAWGQDARRATRGHCLVCLSQHVKRLVQAGCADPPTANCDEFYAAAADHAMLAEEGGGGSSQSLQLPAAPFFAALTKAGKCRCFAPQVCDE